jgi:hypothetical protein
MLANHYGFIQNIDILFLQLILLWKNRRY